MKKFTTLLLFTGLVTGLYAESHEDEEGFKASAGLGVMAEKSPFKGVGTELDPIPVLDISYGDLYFRGSELGYEAFEREKFSVDVFVSFMEGYEVEGGDLDKGYDNIEDRDAQIEGGLIFTYLLPKDYELSARFALGEEGNRYTLEGSKTYSVGKKTIIKPALYATFNDSDFTDYYFGVNEKEAQNNSKIDNKYNAGSSQAYGFELMAEYRLNESFTLIGLAGAEFLSGEIDDSPIVDNSFVYEVGTGFKYNF